MCLWGSHGCVLFSKLIIFSANIYLRRHKRRKHKVCCACGCKKKARSCSKMHIERVHRGVRHEGRGTHLGTAHIRLPLGFVWLAKNLWCEISSDTSHHPRVVYWVNTSHLVKKLANSVEKKNLELVRGRCDTLVLRTKKKYFFVCFLDDC